MLIRRSERIRKPVLAAPFQCPDRPEKFDTPSSESTGACQQLPPMSEVVWIVLDSELENTGYSEVIRSAAQWTVGGVSGNLRSLIGEWKHSQRVGCRCSSQQESVYPSQRPCEWEGSRY